MNNLLSGLKAIVLTEPAMSETSVPSDRQSAKSLTLLASALKYCTMNSLLSELKVALPAERGSAVYNGPKNLHSGRARVR